MALHPKVLFLLKGMDPAIERWWTLNRDPSQIVWPPLETSQAAHHYFFSQKKKEGHESHAKKSIHLRCESSANQLTPEP